MTKCFQSWRVVILTAIQHFEWNNRFNVKQYIKISSKRHPSSNTSAGIPHNPIYHKMDKIMPFESAIFFDRVIELYSGKKAPF